MIDNFEMSKQTWGQIDHLLHKIMCRAGKIKDNEIYRDADHGTALIRRLATEIEIEIDRAKDSK